VVPVNADNSSRIDSYRAWWWSFRPIEPDIGGGGVEFLGVSPCSHGGKPCHAGASSGTAAVVGPSFSPDSATRNYSHHQSNCYGCRHAGCLSTNRSSRSLDHRRAPFLPHHPRRVPYPSGGHVPTDATLGARTNPMRTPRLAA
jgi:hypothetical protein